MNCINRRTQAHTRAHTHLKYTPAAQGYGVHPIFEKYSTKKLVSYDAIRHSKHREVDGWLRQPIASINQRAMRVCLCMRINVSRHFKENVQKVRLKKQDVGIICARAKPNWQTVKRSQEHCMHTWKFVKTHTKT